MAKRKVVVAVPLRICDTFPTDKDDKEGVLFVLSELVQPVHTNKKLVINAKVLMVLQVYAYKVVKNSRPINLLTGYLR
jgi:hypothetical protein